MARQQAVATDGTWAGFVRTEAGMVSGWHHHGEYETVIYVLSGALKMEFGPNGSNTVEAGPGDFVYVPKGAVHRESNPYTVPADIIVVRAGSEEPHVADEYVRPGGAAPPRLVRRPRDGQPSSPRVVGHPVLLQSSDDAVARTDECAIAVDLDELQVESAR